MRRQTRAAHAAVLYDAELEQIASAEDVGRHNALDKVIGKAFLNNQLDRAAILLLSSRISYELVQKAARARIPVILALSRPTALAVELASKLNITLATHSDEKTDFTYSPLPINLYIARNFSAQIIILDAKKL